MKRPRKESDEEKETDEEETDGEDPYDDETLVAVDVEALRGEKDYDDILFGASRREQENWGFGDTCHYHINFGRKLKACFNLQRPPRRTGFDPAVIILPDSDNLWSSENAAKMALKHWNKRKADEEELKFVSLCYANMYRNIDEGFMEYFVTFRAEGVDSGQVDVCQANVEHYPSNRQWQWMISNFRKKKA